VSNRRKIANFHSLKDIKERKHGKCSASYTHSQTPTFYEVPFGYDDVDGITTSLLAAGFSNVKAERLGHIAAIKDISAFARALIFGNPVADEIRGLGGNPKEAVKSIETAIIENLG
jgi:hypothetical protein